MIGKDYEEAHLSWIKSNLELTGKTRQALAAHLGLAHPQITQMLKGERRLKVSEIPKIAEFLGSRPPFQIPQDPRFEEFVRLYDASKEEDRDRALRVAIASLGGAL